MDNTLWIRVQIAQNMPSMRPQALDGSIAVESASKDVQWDLKEGCSHSGSEIFFFFFFLHDTCLNWEKLPCNCFETYSYFGNAGLRLETTENQTLSSLINQSIAQSVKQRIFCPFIF